MIGWGSEKTWIHTRHIWTEYNQLHYNHLRITCMLIVPFPLATFAYEMLSNTVHT